MFLDVPGAPGTPVVSDVTANSMHLRWAEPDTDGGSPITTYVVERRDRFSPRWTPVTRADITQPSFTVTGLVEGQEYEFHVAAQNKAGLGKFSEHSEVRVAKPPYGKLHKTVCTPYFIVIAICAVSGKSLLNVI